MYSDFRSCKICSDNGLYTDGENYCRNCSNYLCLRCSRTHGRNCLQLKGTESKTHLSRNAFSDCCEKTKFLGKKRPTQTLNGGFQSSNDIFNGMESGTKRTLPLDEVRAGGDVIKDLRSLAVSQQLGSPKRISGQVTSNGNYMTLNANQYLQKTSNEGQLNHSTLRKNAGERRESFSDNGGVIRVMNAWTDADQSHSVLSVCTYHPDMNLGVYCKNHDVIFCVDCLNTRHRQCSVQPIEEVALSVLDKPDNATMESKLMELYQICENTRLQLRQHLQNRLAEMKENISSSYGIGHVQSSIVDASTLDKSRNFNSSEKTEIEAKIAVCDDLKQNITLCQQEMRNAELSDNAVQMFIIIHKNKATIEIIERKVQNIVRFTEQSRLNDNSAAAHISSPVHVSNEIATGNTNVRPEENVAQVDKGRCASTKAFSIDRDTGPKSYVIGDVILSPCSDVTAHQKCELADVYWHASSSDDDDDNQNMNKAPRSNMTEKSKRSVSKPNSVGIARNPKDKIKTYGLVTEFYLSEINNEDDGDVLRLQSPVPESSADLYNKLHNTDIRSNIANDTILVPGHDIVNKNINMIKWQDKKLLESVELNHGGEIQPTHRRKACTKRTKKIFESCESELKEVIKTERAEKQKKVKHLKKVRNENMNVMKNTVNHRSVNSGSKSKTIKAKYEVETDAIRLKKWIKQTEEMNKAYEQTKNSLRKDVNKQCTDGVDEVYAANVEIIPSTNSEPPPFMNITIKNAKLLNNARISSAKSQTSDSDEIKYRKQTYASRPRNRLSLFAEHSLRSPNDKNHCKINGVSCMPDGRIVVTDQNNKNIKLFRVGFSKAIEFHLDDPPNGITVVSNTLLAVIAGVLYDRLYLMSVGQSMTVLKRFKTGCECKAVSSYQSHVYLLCLYRFKTEVRVLNTDGVVILRHAFGHMIPSPTGIALNQTNGLMYITDKSEGVYKCESGRILSTTFDDNIGEYKGLVCDADSVVYVTTKDPIGIYEVSLTGKHLMPLVFSSNLQDLDAIAYNDALNCVIVCCNKTGTLSIYSVCDAKQHVQ